MRSHVLAAPEALEVEVAALREQCAVLREERSKLLAALECCDCQPVPPMDLQTRVGGRGDVDHFLGVGRKLHWDIRQQLKQIGRDLREFGSVLEFACGCGRVTRHLRPTPQQRVFGSDIDGEAIGWCQANLSHIAEFSVNYPLPPLRFADGQFDLIYSISVFTHLPEEMQDAWLLELRRVLKPGGVLVTTIHGPSLFDEWRVPERAEFERAGFYYHLDGGVPPLPAFYQTTFHTHEYVRRHWGKVFEIKHLGTRSINNAQDSVVMIKR